MATPIGLRVYQLTVARRGDPEPLPIDTDELRVPLRRFFSRFLSNHRTVHRNDVSERSFYFIPVDGDDRGRSVGHVRYGVFGFESQIVDTETQTVEYDRQRYHAEEVPLFYQLWTPDMGYSAFLALQTFGVRSCATHVLNLMREEFNSRNSEHLFRYTNLIPNDARGSIFNAAPVHSVKLIKRNSIGDLPNRLLNRPEPVDYEVVVKARRGSTLGSLSDMTSFLRQNVESVVQFDGSEFDEARAEIKVGRKIRPVGVFGGSTQTGIIDISDDVERMASGHPTFDSILNQSQDIIEHFHTIVSGRPE